MSELNFDLALSQQFLGDLARNNNLDWMHAHQTEYKLARKQFEDLARISRLNRDTRFSNDKSPYNPVFRIHLSPWGPQPIPCDLFLALTPDTLIVGGGLFASQFAEATALVRQAIVDQADAFSALIQAPEFSVCLPIKGESLKRVPKPFPADHPLADYLKMKSWYLECFAQGNLAPSELVDQITGLAESMRPFNEFLNRALASFTMPQR